MPIDTVRPSIRQAVPQSVATAGSAAPQAVPPRALAVDSTAFSTDVGTERRVQEIASRLRAAMASYDAIQGSHTAWGWRHYATLNQQALAEASATLNSDPVLARRCSTTIEVIDAWNSIYAMTAGATSFGPSGWQSFADDSRSVLNTALTSLDIGR